MAELSLPVHGPGHALKHEGKTTCGWQSRKHLAGSYMGPSPFEQILPLQTCTWFLSSPSTGLNLTEFPIVHFRRRNMFPTATNSLWQTAACVSLGFPQTISWFVWSQKLSCAGTVCPSCICRCHHEELCVPHSLTCFSQTSSIRSYFLWCDMECSWGKTQITTATF